MNPKGIATAIAAVLIAYIFARYFGVVGLVVAGIILLVLFKGSFT